MRSNIHSYSIIAFSSAIIAVLAQITIPLPLIPMTGQSLAIGLIATILPIKLSIMAVTLYILIGALGIPVYANFSGGLGILFGPTGGFLFSFIVAAFFISYYLSKCNFTMLHCFIANLVGMLINLTLGSIWLKYYLNIDFRSAFMSGFVAFLLVGIIKAFLASWAGLQIRNRLQKAKLLAFK